MKKFLSRINFFSFIIRLPIFILLVLTLSSSRCNMPNFKVLYIDSLNYQKWYTKHNDERVMLQFVFNRSDITLAGWPATSPSDVLDYDTDLLNLTSSSINVNINTSPLYFGNLKLTKKATKDISDELAKKNKFVLFKPYVTDDNHIAYEIYVTSTLLLPLSSFKALAKADPSPPAPHQ